jgi:hypothetical protein
MTCPPSWSGVMWLPSQRSLVFLLLMIVVALVGVRAVWWLIVKEWAGIKLSLRQKEKARRKLNWKRKSAGRSSISELDF